MSAGSITDVAGILVGHHHRLDPDAIVGSSEKAGSGWACGTTELVAGVRAAKQYLSYVGGAPFQPAVAYALNHEDAWVDALRDALQSKRDRLAAALAGGE